MKVLIAEDSATSRVVVEEWVRTWGYQPIVAADGMIAWNIITHEDPPNLALIDWMMPNMDGIELCQRIKQSKNKNTPFTYIILLTSKNSKEDIVTGLDAGADDFLSKPVQPEELRSRLDVGSRIIHYHQKLREMDEQKNKFLGMAAHDLRSPLTSIMGFSQLMLENPMDEKHQREFLGIIHQVSQEMLNTVNDLLDISVIESGKFDLNPKQDDLVKLIHYRVRLANMNAKHKNIEINTCIPNSQMLFFDADRLGQVLDNFITNAVKYSPEGTHILVMLQQKDRCVEVSVIDEGPGIAKAQQQALFGAFQKAGVRPTGGEKSIGLGLAIVKKIVESHQGTVGVSSEEGKGSRFYFTLPLT
jgi:signal transduction histidine kinase